MTTNRSIRTITAALLLSMATVGTAQHSPDPFAAMGGGVYRDGGWVPRDNPAVAGAAAPQAQPQPQPQVSVACDYISPYLDRPGCIVGDYRIGQVYQFGEDMGIVIGLSMASTGAEVVTVQWQHAPIPDMPAPPIQVWAFVNDGSQRPWEWRR